MKNIYNLNPKSRGIENLDKQIKLDLPESMDTIKISKVDPFDKLINEGDKIQKVYNEGVGFVVKTLVNILASILITIITKKITKV